MSADGAPQTPIVVVVPLPADAEVSQDWLTHVKDEIERELAPPLPKTWVGSMWHRVRRWRVVKHPLSWLKKVEALLALVAILFAYVQYRDAREAAHGLRSALNQLDDISARESWQYDGEFPNNIERINNEVLAAKNAQKEIVILTDYPGYGHYSAPDAFEKYEKEIIVLASQRKRYHVRMLVYSDKEAHVMVNDQFNRDAFDTTRSSEKFSAYFKNNPREGGPPTTYDEFAEALLKKNREYERQFCAWGVEIEYYDSPANIFFWVNGESNAVLSFNKRDKEGREETFSTADSKLARALTSVFNRMWDEGEKTRCKTGDEPMAPAPAVASPGSASPVPIAPVAGGEQ